jgi:hypothetical protein
MVAFSCDGDDCDISTDFSSSAPSSSSSSSSSSNNNNSNNEESTSEQQPKRYLRMNKTALMKKKAVTFSDIKVWEFETCVGDNPSMSSGGCPIALTNKHTRTTSMPVDKAEALRSSPYHHRRSLQELMLDRDSREERYVTYLLCVHVCVCCILLLSFLVFVRVV